MAPKPVWFKAVERLHQNRPGLKPLTKPVWFKAFERLYQNHSGLKPLKSYTKTSLVWSIWKVTPKPVWFKADERLHQNQSGLKPLKDYTKIRLLKQLKGNIQNQSGSIQLNIK